MAEVLSSGGQDMATRADLREALTETKFELLKWVVGLALAQMSLLIGILLKLT